VPNVNALLAAARDLAAFPAALPVGAQHPLLGTTTVVATQLKAGERHNVVPDLAEAVFDARVAPGVSADEVRAALAQKLPHAEVTIRSKRLQAIETAPDHPVVRAALAAAGRAAPIASRTLSDMAFLQGVPAVKCGPGATARSHTPDEYVLRGELLAGIEFYTKAAPAILAALAEPNR
jgi:acetylornithine deacetylase